MNTINVTYNINSDEVIRQVDDTMRRITEITRSNSSEQVRLMTEVYSSLTYILDNYMSNVRNQFSTYIDIAKNTWNMASSDAKDYFNEMIKKQDEMNDNYKSGLDKQIDERKDALKEKLLTVDEEMEAELDRIDNIQKAEKQAYEERKRNLSEFNKNVKDVMGGVGEMGGVGSTTKSIMQMGGNLIGGATNIATGLNAGQGIKDIMGVMTQGIGMLVESVKKTDDLKRDIITSSGMQGKDISNIYNNDLDYEKRDSLLNKLKSVAGKYADTPEMTEKSQLQMMKQFSQSRQFGENDDYHKMGVESTLIGKSRGLQGSEVANLFIDMKQKLNEPMDNLVGRFFQLDNISKDLGINLKDVIRDYQRLMNDNIKYGYSQEQLMGFYSEFGEEIKQGTVSVSQLSEYMKGLAGMGTDKSVGVVSLLMANQEETMKNFSGDKQGANKLFDILGGANNELDQAQIFRMMQNPEADYSNDPFLSNIMKENNLTPELLKKMKPISQQLISGTSMSMASQSGEGMGAGRLIEEQLMRMMGMDLSDNLYDSGKQQKMISSFGKLGDVRGLEGAKNEGQGVINNQNNILTELAPWTSQLELTLQKSIEKTASITEKVWKETNGNIEKTGSAMYESIKREGEDIISMFGGESWIDKTDKFGDSVDKFAHTMGIFSDIMDVAKTAWKVSTIPGQISIIKNLFSSDDDNTSGKKGELNKVVEGLERGSR